MTAARSSQNTDLPKLSIPKFHKIYRRQRLNKLLATSVEKAATWVQGPAGSGKTTLIASFLGVSTRQILWYQIDQGDKDPASFFHHLTLIVKRLSPRSKIKLPILTSEYMGSLDVFTRNYFRVMNQRLKKSYVLVLDNFQDINDKSNLQAALAKSIEEMPDFGHIFFISRVYPSEVFSRLQINQQISLIDWNTLKLTSEECEEYIDYLCASEGCILTREQYDDVWENTNGWITGVMLQIRSSVRNNKSIASFGSNTTQLMFDYFASELFDKQTSAVREFMMKTAFLPVINLKHAIDLTGEVSAKEILNFAHKQHFFTDCLSLENSTYRYHQLFREFLLMKAYSIWQEDVVLGVYNKSAEILEGDGYINETVDLYLNAKQWGKAIKIICDNASESLDKGYYSLVSDWIDKIPVNVIDGYPWLKYWKAMALLIFNPRDARSLLESAYEDFKASNNSDGTLMSWTGLIESYMFLRDDYSPLGELIDDIDLICKNNDSFISHKIKFSMIGAGLMVVMFYKPGHHLLPIWAKEIKEVVLGDDDLGIRIKLAGYLMHYYSWMGDIAGMEVIYEYINPSVKPEAVAPLYEIIWSWAVSLYSWMTNNNELGKLKVENAMSLSLSNGIDVWNFALYTQSAYLALFESDEVFINESLQGMLNNLRQDYALDSGHYHYLAGWSCYKNRDYKKADEHIRIAIAMTHKASTAYPNYLSEYARSIIAISNEDYNNAESILDRVHDFSVEINSNILLYKFLLAKAWIYLLKINHIKASDCLVQAISIAKENKYLNFDWLSHDCIVDLSIFALKNEIESDYIHHMLSCLKIKPDARAVCLEKWPWPVKIFTLGQFKVLVNNKEIEIKQKGNKKLMDMLKAIIALGVSDVNSETLQEIIWPDADGDKAQQNFNVTLHRLRKLLGSNQSIILTNSKVSLNRKIVWLDVSVFLDVTGENLLINECSETNVYDFMRYYKGDFLIEESSDYWMLAVREKIRNRFLNQINQLGSYFLDKCDFDRAIEVYNMGLEIDVCVEGFYYGLIKAHVSQNHMADAALVYQRCSNALNNIFGLKPSLSMEALLSNKK